mmetsp:Transcript_27733/g.65857  ORF Transcript_27733/g.65857 Transcript_27733/m.65857 type:complete len:436 (+) Transcript_27733:230-1537(+)
MAAPSAAHSVIQHLRPEPNSLTHQIQAPRHLLLGLREHVLCVEVKVHLVPVHVDEAEASLLVEGPNLPADLRAVVQHAPGARDDGLVGHRRGFQHGRLHRRRLAHWVVGQRHVPGTQPPAAWHELQPEAHCGPGDQGLGAVGVHLALQLLDEVPDLEIHVRRLALHADEAETPLRVVGLDAAHQLAPGDDLLLHLRQTAPFALALAVVRLPAVPAIPAVLVIPLAPAFGSEHVGGEAARGRPVPRQHNLPRLPSVLRLGVGGAPHHAAHGPVLLAPLLGVRAHVPALEVDVDGIPRDVEKAEALVLVEAPDHPRELDAVQHQAPTLQQVHVPGVPAAVGARLHAAAGQAPGKAVAAHQHEHPLGRLVQVAAVEVEVHARPRDLQEAKAPGVVEGLHRGGDRRAVLQDHRLHGQGVRVADGQIRALADAVRQEPQR